jgi:hypothetical protein
MKPKINSTTFGSITIAGKAFERDVLIRLEKALQGRVWHLARHLTG